MHFPVTDPFGAACDAAMPSLAKALDPVIVRERFKRGLRLVSGGNGIVRPTAIRVMRYKPGRRCVIEYDVQVDRWNAPCESLTLIGKVRVKRFGASDLRLLQAFWNAGFDDQSSDGISVPRPAGLIPELKMWLQLKVPGQIVTNLLGTPGGPALAGKVAEAAHKLHRAGVAAERRHVMADELRILQGCLQNTALARPQLTERLARLYDACYACGAELVERLPCGIHRDFYSDQVIADGSRLYLIDFDLYCSGNPALDVGNFLGHITEQSLRTQGDPAALADREEALEGRFIELAGEDLRPAVHVYAVLTLARHIYLSTRFPERQPWTTTLLELCEERLGLAANPPTAACAKGKRL